MRLYVYFDIIVCTPVKIYEHENDAYTKEYQEISRMKDDIFRIAKNIELILDIFTRHQ